MQRQDGVLKTLVDVMPCHRFRHTVLRCAVMHCTALSRCADARCTLPRYESVTRSVQVLPELIWILSSSYLAARPNWPSRLWLLVQPVALELRQSVSSQH